MSEIVKRPPPPPEIPPSVQGDHEIESWLFLQNIQELGGPNGYVSYLTSPRPAPVHPHTDYPELDVKRDARVTLTSLLGLVAMRVDVSSGEKEVAGNTLQGFCAGFGKLVEDKVLRGTIYVKNLATFPLDSWETRIMQWDEKKIVVEFGEAALLIVDQAGVEPLPRMPLLGASVWRSVPI